MISKVVHKQDLNEYDEIRENLSFWLDKSPSERISAVDFLRRQYHGITGRLQRTVRIVQRS
ncbi:MAG: hypothetical protein NTX61_16820 [Bacteroidetes bacterium]|nr:hypothetical protein [Bacteroidota bacterium]